MWNIASATTDGSGIVLYDDTAPKDVDLIVEVASDELPEDAEPRATIALAECQNLSLRVKTAVAAATSKPILLRIELTGSRSTACSPQVMHKPWRFACSTVCAMH